MKLWKVVLTVLSVFVLGAGAAAACHVEGYVFCDTNGNDALDPGDKPLAGVTVTVTDNGFVLPVAITDANGYYFVDLSPGDQYVETLTAGLPANPTYIIPASGSFQLDTSIEQVIRRDWLVDSPECHVGLCWLTGGGAKLDSVTGLRLAERGPQQSFGGNVYPGCSPTAGDGGNWNHVNRALKIHFQGTTIQVVDCGNVPGIPDGSESPKTPFNYIEFQGTGRVMGVAGNKTTYPDPVYFFARCEDRNEPGSNGAKDGALIDRYFLHVFSDPMNPIGTTIMIIDSDANPGTEDPVPITDGNLQIHISSCDTPPM